MKVNVVEVNEHWVVVQFIDTFSSLQRRMIPKALSPTTTKGPVTLSRNLVYSGMEYSNVDLEAELGEMYLDIPVSILQNKLRERGFWTAADYQKNPRDVQWVVRQLAGANISITDILNAAARHT